MDEPKGRMVSGILKWSGVGKQIIAGVLMVLMFLLVGFATIEIVLVLIQMVIPGSLPPSAHVVISEAMMLEVLGTFLSVLIVLELIQTVEVYFRDQSIHVEIVMLVAIIALARKIIILDLNKYAPPVLFALGFLLLALGATYYLVKLGAKPID